jgi:hypothetical protein
LQSNVYNNGEIRARQQGDARGQRYGLPGDYRIQDHGYEYRTFPSWLDSPHLAFLMLTLSKLAVYDPPLAQSMYSRVRPQAAMENFLAYYRDTDDDARLAYALVRRMRGFPRHEGQDFRARWGIPLSQFAMPPSITVLPRSVPADEATVEELFKLFMHGEILKFSMPTPTWEPLRQPEGYDMLLAYTSTLQQKGLGELVWDLCTHKKLPIIFQGMGRNAKWAIWLSTPLAKALPSNWHVLLGDNTNYVKSVQGLSTHNVLQIGMDWREGTKRKLIREMLTCGAFPIWKVSDVKASSYEDWANGAAKHKQTFNSKILFQQGKSLI